MRKRTMLKAIGASVLMLALCGPAFAGNIPCPTVAAPTASALETEDTDGQSDTPPAADIFYDVALNLLSIF
jgi:hypothetical protein